MPTSTIRSRWSAFQAARTQHAPQAPTRPAMALRPASHRDETPRPARPALVTPITSGWPAG